MTDSLNVFLFFLLGSGIFAFVGFKFWSLKVNPFRDFGIAIAMFGLAFMGWGFVVYLKPTELAMPVALSIVPFVLGFIFMVSSATFNWQKNNRLLTFIIAVAFLVGLFALRTYVLPSDPHFSDSGLLYFGAKPEVLILYVLAFGGAFMPALHVISSRMTVWRQAALTRIFFNLIVLGGVIMMVSKNDHLQVLNSYILTVGFVGLLVNLGFGKVQVESK
ncbi:MAG: hypothetical protein ACKOFA_06125 [Rhodoluna sp.]